MMQRLKKITVIATLCIAILIQNALAVHAAEPRYLACPECGGKVSVDNRDNLVEIVSYACTDSTHNADCLYQIHYDISITNVVCETSGCPTTRQEIVRHGVLYEGHTNP